MLAIAPNVACGLCVRPCELWQAYFSRLLEFDVCLFPGLICILRSGV